MHPPPTHALEWLNFFDPFTKPHLLYGKVSDRENISRGTRDPPSSMRDLEKDTHSYLTYCLPRQTLLRQDGASSMKDRI